MQLAYAACKGNLQCNVMQPNVILSRPVTGPKDETGEGSGAGTPGKQPERHDTRGMIWRTSMEKYIEYDTDLPRNNSGVLCA